MLKMFFEIFVDVLSAATSSLVEWPLNKKETITMDKIVTVKGMR